VIDMFVLGKKPMEKRIEYKICVLGDEGVGKTSLIRRFVDNKFEEGYTEEKQISKKEEIYVSVEENGLPKSDVIALSIWDWVSSITRKQSYNNAKGALLVSSITEKISLLSLEYWKNELYEVAGKVPIVVAINKGDLRKQRQIEKIDLKNASKKIKAPLIVTSAKSGKNVKKTFYKLAQKLI